KRTYELPVGISNDDYSSKEIVVRLKNRLPATSKVGRTSSPLSQFETKQFLSYLEGDGKSTNARAANHPLNNIYTVTINEGDDPIEVINELLKNEEVLYAEPYFNHRPLFIPNDPEAQPGASQWYLTNIRAYDAWTIEKGSEDIIIGILDTGVLPEHADLTDNLYINEDDPINGVDDDNDGLVDNYKGWDIANNDNNTVADTDIHGLGVTGVSSASTNNGLGLAGVGFKSKFMPIKIFRSGSNSFARGYEAIALAADLGCQVINLSWGSAGSFSQSGQDVIDYAVEVKDAVVVASAGNTNALLDFYPASFKNVLSVGASNIGDEKADFATYSYNIDLMAPGKDIYVMDGDSVFRTRQGTSYSGPMVAGAAALLRARFPDLSAKQIMERIRVNTDDIYQISANQAYPGQLGKGRLNVLKALTDNMSPSLRIEDYAYTNGIGEEAFFGDTLSITVDITNYLSSTSKATATLSSSSPYVEVLDGEFNIGALSTLGEKTNENSPFKIKLSNNLPASQELVLRIDFSDGIYNDFQHIVIKSSPSYTTLNNGELALTVGSTGELGYNKDIFQEGIGLMYQGQKILDNIGFIIASDEDTVKDTAPRNLNLNLRDHDFSAISKIKYYRNSQADIDLRSTYRDSPALSNRLDIQVQQKVLAWKDSSLSNAVVVEYRITNTSANTISNIHTGIFADWNLNDKNFNRASWDNSNLLGYVKDIMSDSIYAGLALANSETPFYYAINNRNANGNTANIPNNITDDAKYDIVSQGIAQTEAGQFGMGNDVSHTSGYTISSLSANESKKLAFVLVAGSSLAEIQAATNNALAKYNEYLNTPPLIEIAEACPGDNAIIDPSDGNVYEFYADVDLTNLLYTGSAFTTTLVTSPQVYYVVNKDNAYDGDIYRVMARPKPTNADFNMSTDLLLLDETSNTEVTITDKSVDAVSWSWDFGNGFTSSVQHPLMNYSNPGIYTIELTAINDLGCIETVSKDLEVAYRSNKPNISGSTICKGDEVELTATNATSLNFYSDENKNNLIFTGTTFNTGKLYQDTTFYITSVDSTYESNVKEVKILMSAIKADFKVEIDTTDLSSKNLLQLKNNSQNESLYVWFVNNTLAGNSTDISYDYSGQSSFDLSLMAEDINGCRDTLIQTIVPKVSPAPGISSIQICKGESVNLTPENGSVFLFYNDESMDDILHKGTSFDLDNLNADTTFYITSIDSLVESSPTAVNIDVSNIAASFNLSHDTLDLSEIDLLTVTDDSQEATDYNWYVDDSLISTAQLPSFDFSNPGDYKIELKVSNSIGCSDSTSQTLHITKITGTNLKISDFNVFPNPTYDQLKFEGPQVVDLKIVDLKGKTYYEEQAIRNTTIDTESLPDGIYILEIKQGNETTYKKIMKASR
ncbi:PKD domain-containing protein, partial [Fulvivirga sp. RKSG066]|uniref:S8 family serine peptidase n=1 Tax=Fulvivirga aurantia TaxID=2529383 RepID=UPI0012BD54F8